MGSVANRILEYLRSRPDGADDDEVADGLGLTVRQHANAECRRLAARGLLERRLVRGKLRNFAVPGAHTRLRQPEPGHKASVTAPGDPSLRQQDEPAQAASMPPAGSNWLRARSFAFVCRLEPERDAAGLVATYDPGHGYSSQRRERHRYGVGPFCRFRVPRTGAGVYAMVINGQITYVGSAANLASRFNSGYGQISPRNVFIGGQETNCRVNQLVLSAANSERAVELWFLPTPDFRAAEAALIGTLQPEWNRAGVNRD